MIEIYSISTRLEADHTMHLVKPVGNMMHPILWRNLQDFFPATLTSSPQCYSIGGHSNKGNKRK
jgi:hypothetical protein